MKQLTVYLHGKGGNAEETGYYQLFFTDSDVVGFDYQSQNPWEARNEFSPFFDLQKENTNLSP